MAQKKANIRVQGMTCEGCTASLTRALKRTPGVRDAVVSLDNQSASVTYNADQVNEEQLRQIVEQVGFVPLAG